MASDIHHEGGRRDERAANLIKELAAQFLERENNGTSLITVTHATCSPDLRRATIYITVLPETAEQAALDFAKRRRSDLRDYVKKNMNTKTVPFLDVEIDRGEKNRQRIDSLLRE